MQIDLSDETSRRIDEIMAAIRNLPRALDFAEKVEFLIKVLRQLDPDQWQLAGARVIEDNPERHIPGQTEQR